MTSPGLFWEDLAADLADPQVRADYERVSAQIQAYDAARNADEPAEPEK